MLPFLRLRSVMWMTTLTSCMRSGRGWTISKANSCAHGTWLESFVWCLTMKTPKTKILECWIWQCSQICGFCGGWDGDEGPGCTEAPARLHWGHMAKSWQRAFFQTWKQLCKCADVLLFVWDQSSRSCRSLLFLGATSLSLFCSFSLVFFVFWLSCLSLFLGISFSCSSFWSLFIVFLSLLVSMVCFGIPFVFCGLILFSFGIFLFSFGLFLLLALLLARFYWVVSSLLSRIWSLRYWNLRKISSPCLSALVILTFRGLWLRVKGWKMLEICRVGSCSRTVGRPFDASRSPDPQLRLTKVQSLIFVLKSSPFGSFWQQTPLWSGRFTFEFHCDLLYLLHVWPDCSCKRKGVPSGLKQRTARERKAELWVGRGYHRWDMKFWNVNFTKVHANCGSFRLSLLCCLLRPEASFWFLRTSRVFTPRFQSINAVKSRCISWSLLDENSFSKS